jgi:hypothetical protein
VSDNVDTQTLESAWVQANSSKATGQGFHQFEVQASSYAAMMVIEIRINNEQIQASPVFVQVRFPDCVQKFRVQTAHGCVCEEGFTEFAEQCVDSMKLAGQATAAGLAVLALLLLGSKFFFQYTSDRAWRIIPSDLKFSSPPEWIGSGRNTVVYRGEYQNMEIAAKTVQRASELPSKVSCTTMQSDTGAQHIGKTLSIKLGKGPGVFAGGRWQQGKQHTAAWNLSDHRVGKGLSYFSALDHRDRMRKLV